MPAIELILEEPRGSIKVFRCLGFRQCRDTSGEYDLVSEEYWLIRCLDNQLCRVDAIVWDVVSVSLVEV